jgi:hypothetical protein
MSPNLVAEGARALQSFRPRMVTLPVASAQWRTEASQTCSRDGTARIAGNTFGSNNSSGRVGSRPCPWRPVPAKSTYLGRTPGGQLINATGHGHWKAPIGRLNVRGRNEHHLEPSLSNELES